MKVILNDYIEHLGERGETVNVKPGYARNYLIPLKLAYPDTVGNRARFVEEQSKWEEMDLSRKSAADKMAAELTGTELLYERRASEKDVLFGSVNVADLSHGLADKGFDIDKRRILLGQPIKNLGSFEVGIQIHRDVQVIVPVHVIRPGEELGADRAPAPAEEEAVVEAVVATDDAIPAEAEIETAEVDEVASE